MTEHPLHPEPLLADDTDRRSNRRSTDIRRLSIPFQVFLTIGGSFLSAVIGVAMVMNGYTARIDALQGQLAIMSEQLKARDRLDEEVAKRRDMEALELRRVVDSIRGKQEMQAVELNELQKVVIRLEARRSP